VRVKSMQYESSSKSGKVITGPRPFLADDTFEPRLRHACEANARARLVPPGADCFARSARYVWAPLSQDLGLQFAAAEGQYGETVGRCWEHHSKGDFRFAGEQTKGMHCKCRPRGRVLWARHESTNKVGAQKIHCKPVKLFLSQFSVAQCR
jgi:hypothetical protein